MAPPKRRSTRPTTPAAPTDPPIEEKKPDLLIAYDSDEKFVFSFSEEGLTAKECAEKMNGFSTKEQFLTEVHVDEMLRFLTKVIIGRKGEPLKCLCCDRLYVSSSGFLIHIKKCSTKNEQDRLTDAQNKYRNEPSKWLNVRKKDQIATLKTIVGTNYTCFMIGCSLNFGSLKDLIEHLATCIGADYYSYKNRPDDFRKLSKKAKQAYTLDAVTKNKGIVKCLVCDKEYTNHMSIIYHIDRCQVDKSLQPWKCWRCGFDATAADAQEHLIDCGRTAEMKMFDRLPESSSFGFPIPGSSVPSTSEPTTSAAAAPTKRKRVTGGAPRATPRKDGTTLYRFRKSTISRSSNGIVTKKDKKLYEDQCSKIFENWKQKSAEIAFCDTLSNIANSKWKLSILDSNDQFYRIFTRQSVTLVSGKTLGLQQTVPPGIRLDALKSREMLDEDDAPKATVGYCGAPINSINVAPGKTRDGSDVICVTTFANDTDLESDSSCVQFWKHKLGKKKKSHLELWFLIHLPLRGTILHATWLQKQHNDEMMTSLIGYVAFSTTIGQILIYKIDESRVPEAPDRGDNVHVIVADPDLTLRLPKSTDTPDDTFLNADVKMEGDDIVVLPTRIDESTVPLLKIAWSYHNGGATLAALTALGAIAIWNLDGGDLDMPRVNIEESWQSPPSDIAFWNIDHLVVGFREKIVKVISIETWDVMLEDNTAKNAGSRVHTDNRIVRSFFMFQSDHTAFPYPNATNLTYVHCDIDTMTMILVPTGNTHQLLTWDVAMCPAVGTLLSSGIDGRLVASATGRFLGNMRHSYFANRNVMALKRRRILKESQTMEEYLKEVKMEGSAEGSTSTSTTKISDDKINEPLEESITEHTEVCQKMWLDVQFDEIFEPTRPEFSCRDQRIESLNCVDGTTSRDWPVSFTGGEAGLLFAVSVKLHIEEMDL